MKKKSCFIASFILFAYLFPQIVHTCSSFYLNNGSQPVFGCNVDLYWGDCLIIVNKRNVSKTAVAMDSVAGQQPAVWSSKYGSITFTQTAQEFPWQGMNEAGLAVSSMLLRESQVPEPDSRPYVFAGGQWMQYILDNFSTVEEVIESNSQIRLAGDLNSWDNHYLVCDSTGNCVVVEYLDGEMVYYNNETLPYKTLTNTRYDQSLNFLSDYVGFGGTLPIPDADPYGNSLNRFVRAAYMLEDYDETDSIEYGFDILEYVKQEWYISTQRSIVFDINNLRIYFRSLNNSNIRYLDFSSFDFSCETPVTFLNIDTGLAGDVSNELINITQQINKTQAEIFYPNFAPSAPPGDVEATWLYPDEQTYCIPEGDLNEDGCVDRADFSIIISEIRGPEPHNMVYDLNGDGNVNISDARYLATVFTNPRGAACE